MLVRDRLRTIRQFKKISTHKLAEMVDMGQSKLSRMELGKINITVEDIIVIANALQVPVEAFFYDEKMLDVLKEARND